MTRQWDMGNVESCQQRIAELEGQVERWRDLAVIYYGTSLTKRFVRKMLRGMRRELARRNANQLPTFFLERGIAAWEALLDHGDLEG